MLPDRLAQHIFRVEGGLSDAAADRGGRTFRGITAATLEAARREDPALPSDPAALSELQIREIYFRRYYLPARCGDLPPPADLLLFDAAVHHGVTGGVRLFQKGVNRLLGSQALRPDGHSGSRTREVTTGIVESPGPVPGDRALVLASLLERAFFFQEFALRLPAQRIFLPGWLRRLRELATAAGI